MSCGGPPDGLSCLLQDKQSGGGADAYLEVAVTAEEPLMLVVAGDALVDLVGDAEHVYRAHPGGSCFNVAMALGRLGLDVGFASPLSEDALGRLLAATLARSGVKLLIAGPVAAPTPLAVVSVDAGGSATYAFYRERTADRTVTVDGLVAALPAHPRLYHIGSLALIGAEDSACWLEAARVARARGAVVSLDPNVRAGLIDDLGDYRRRMEEAFSLADVVKISDEDLEVLAPGETAEDAFEATRQRHGPAVAVLTRGKLGAVGVSAAGVRVVQPALMPGPMVDTIGAGDSLQAGLLWAIETMGLLDRQRLASVSRAQLAEALETGALAAGIDCTREGADPPWADELAQAIDARRQN